MRTFAQKHKAGQQNTSARSTVPGRSHLEQSRKGDSILQLQGTIGNQAVQRMLPTNAKEPQIGSTPTASPRIGHDFSRVRIPADDATIRKVWQSLSI